LLKEKTTAITEEEFTTIKKRILDMLTVENVALQNMLQTCKNIRKEKL
jgi:hypothetical protein